MEQKGKLHLFFSSSITWGVLALYLGSVACSGRFSVSLSYALLIIALLVGSWGVLRSECDGGLKVVFVFVLVVGSLFTYTWLRVPYPPPSNEQTRGKQTSFKPLSTSKKILTKTIYKTKENTIFITQTSNKNSSNTIPQIYVIKTDLINLEAGKKLKAITAYKTDKPIYKVTSDIMLVITPEPISENIKLTPNSINATAPYIPANEVKSLLFPDDEILTSDSANLIKNNKLLIYIWGSMYYFDSNNNKHTFDICAKYLPDHNGFSLCPFHNETR